MRSAWLESLPIDLHISFFLMTGFQHTGVWRGTGGGCDACPQTHHENELGWLMHVPNETNSKMLSTCPQ